jgi:hypothetical protein
MARLHATGCGTVLALSAATLFTATATAQTAKVPNLVALPAKDISLQPSPTVADGWLIRFSTQSWNKGTGPLELVAGEIDTAAQKRKVNQRIYDTDGTYTDVYAGSFVWHPAHNHFHFERYALYTLQPINAPGGSSRTGAKTTFCVMDTDHINGSVAGSPSSAYYATCGNAVQGMSVGWGDTYGSHLAGQSLDFTGQPDGLYQLKIKVDPNDVLTETTRSDNDSCVLLKIQKPSLTVVDASGSCSAVESITPVQGRSGSQVQVTITGYEFSQSSTVVFEGGVGPRPVASNVVLTNDSPTGLDTLTATVTIPYKKQISNKAVWDVRVGQNAVLPDAFRVTK